MQMPLMIRDDLDDDNEEIEDGLFDFVKGFDLVTLDVVGTSATPVVDDK